MITTIRVIGQNEKLLSDSLKNEFLNKMSELYDKELKGYEDVVKINDSTISLENTYCIINKDDIHEIARLLNTLGRTRDEKYNETMKFLMDLIQKSYV